MASKISTPEAGGEDSACLTGDRGKAIMRKERPADRLRERSFVRERIL